VSAANVSTGNPPLIDERRMIDGIWHGWAGKGWIAETYSDNVFWPVGDKSILEIMDGQRRMIWMLVQESGGTVYLTPETKQNWPGDERATVEQIEQPASGVTILRARP
jgi:hypothetical protein